MTEIQSFGNPEWLTKEEQNTFESDGYIILRNVLSSSLIKELKTIASDIYSKQNKPGLRLYLSDIIHYDERLLKFIDYYKTFPKIVDILGWNISLYYTHLIVTPPSEGEGIFDAATIGGWHQDGQYINVDLTREGNNNPRLTTKAAFYATDCNKVGMGNMVVIPGSMLAEKESDLDKSKAIPVLANAGDVVIFDRRLWHTASENFSDITRQVFFVGYGYRWLAPADNMTVEHLVESANPVQKQLLRVKTRDDDFFNPWRPGQSAIKEWLEKTKKHER